MTIRAALRAALHDFSRQAWRLFMLNTALWFVVALVVLVGILVPPALLLVLGIGPLLAALMHCAVTLAQTEDLKLADATEGLRLHWRRGLALFALVAGSAVVIATAVLSYAQLGGLGRVAAALAIYAAAFFGVYQVALWPLAIYERERALRGVLGDAFLAVFRRPLGFFALATVLLLVNAAGAAAALVPLLTVTVAYSFLAAAHYTLPVNPARRA